MAAVEEMSWWGLITSRLMWLLPIGALISVAGLLLAGYSMMDNIRDNTRSDRILRAQAADLREQNARQQEQLRLLCDRGYMLDALVQASIVLVAKPPDEPGERIFIREFTIYHEQLIHQLTDPKSPCVA